MLKSGSDISSNSNVVNILAEQSSEALMTWLEKHDQLCTLLYLQKPGMYCNIEGAATMVVSTDLLCMHLALAGRLQIVLQ